MKSIFSICTMLLLASGLWGQNPPARFSAPNLASDYIRIAADWDKKGDYEKAILNYSQAIKIDPEFVDAYLGRGASWVKKGEREKALADYSEAIRINPRRADVYNNRGIIWDELKQFDKAIADYNQAIRINSELADAWYGRGSSWYGKGDYDKAIADYNEAIRINPRYAMAYRLRGVAWDEKNEYARAIADFNKALSIEPGYAMAYYCRGFAHFNHYHHELAMKDFASASSLNPAYAYAALNLAMSRMRLGEADYANLLDQAARVLGEDWPMPVIRFYTGRLKADEMLAAARDPDETKQRIQHCEAEFYLAEWQLLHGQQFQAIDSFGLARAECPHHYYEYIGAGNELTRISASTPQKSAH